MLAIFFKGESGRTQIHYSLFQTVSCSSKWIRGFAQKFQNMPVNLFCRNIIMQPRFYMVDNFIMDFKGDTCPSYRLTELFFTERFFQTPDFNDRYIHKNIILYCLPKP